MQHLRPLKSEAKTSNAIGTFRSADDDAEANGPIPKLTGSLSGSRLCEFKLDQHKPLGCSVEESLANEPDAAKHVFVADVNKGGNAEKIGLRVGDVIVQLSGTFDEVLDVTGLGIEKM
jgi:S1-C subfamily serine protease